MASERLDVILSLITGNYKREAHSAADATGKIGKAASTTSPFVGELRSNIARLAGPAAIGALVGGLGRLALALGENADRLFDLESQTGASTDQLQEYEFVAAAAGAKTEFFSDSVKQVIRSLDQAVAGTGAVSEAYDKLGISVLDVNGRIRNGADITEDIIDKLAGMTNETERNGLAQDIFGKKWEEVTSVLDMGTEAIENLKNEAHELGVVIDEETLVAADRLRENFEKLRAAASAQAGLALVNIGTNIAAWFGDERSKDLVVYSEALNSIRRRTEEGVPAWEAFSRALFRTAEHSDLTSEELLDLASAAGIAIEEMTDEQWEQFAIDLLKQAQAAGLDAEAIEELRLTLLATSPEALAMARAAEEGAAGLEDQEAAAEGARDRLNELADAQRNVTRAALEAADPIFAAVAAVGRFREATARLEELRAAKAPLDDINDALLNVAETKIDRNAALLLLGQGNLAAGIALIGDALNMNDEATRTWLGSLLELDGTALNLDFNLNFRTTGIRPDLIDRLPLPKPILTSPTNTLIEQRQHGGPAYAGRPYLVGEAGREMFIPQRSGTIMSAGDTRAALTGARGGGDTHYHFPNARTVDRSAIELAGTLAGVKRRVEARR